jgi:hypothetical protein
LFGGAVRPFEFAITSHAANTNQSPVIRVTVESLAIGMAATRLCCDAGHMGRFHLWPKMRTWRMPAFGLGRRVEPGLRRAVMRIEWKSRVLAFLGLVAIAWIATDAVGAIANSPERGPTVLNSFLVCDEQNARR